MNSLKLADLVPLAEHYKLTELKQNLLTIADSVIFGGANVHTAQAELEDVADELYNKVLDAQEPKTESELQLLNPTMSVE